MGQGSDEAGSAALVPVTFWSEQRVGMERPAAPRRHVVPAASASGQGFLRRREGRDGHREATRSRPQLDQGENLFLWAEAALIPSAVVSRPGVRWQPINETSARMVLPLRDEQDEMVFSFDPETRLIREARALRYREVGGPKIGWRVQYLNWRRFGEVMFPGRRRAPPSTGTLNDALAQSRRTCRRPVGLGSVVTHASRQLSVNFSAPSSRFGRPRLKQEAL